MTERVIWEASSLPYLVQERRWWWWRKVARFEMQGSAENDAIARAKTGAYTRVVRYDGLSADYS
ncbi:hypothetical protein [Gulosibacter molinativorax]|uniref:DUF1508 domain-containing protein n=1 Tax=Gulosibacter molinativorax TaxID=256821 RepID=A0ABT7C631_9MICO|nr:hypothetical protein [Gulosibacter molinativorax]MDJ1370640.1 hypothetical protein [Gulosibacter molinativorax]QUY63337.1 Hypotetical protein [Gulosibacter molinativorax]